MDEILEFYSHEQMLFCTRNDHITEAIWIKNRLYWIDIDLVTARNELVPELLAIKRRLLNRQKELRACHSDFT